MSAADKDPPGWPALALCTAVTIPLRTSLAIFRNSEICMFLFLSFISFIVTVHFVAGNLLQSPDPFTLKSEKPPDIESRRFFRALWQ